MASVLDIFSRRVVGFALGEHHDAGLAYAALAMAVAVRGGQVDGLIMHTDQGSEYIADLFRASIGPAGVDAGSPSMTSPWTKTTRRSPARPDVSVYLRTAIDADHNGRYTLDWHFDQAALDAEAATDGWYALLTNLPASVSAEQALSRYKAQPATSERRYHDLKGPFAVAPMFLHANRRMTALIGVICLALLVHCLVEHEARRNLAPATKLDGLYAGRAAKPTANLIFTALAPLRLRTASEGTPEIPEPDIIQKRVLRLLRIDPRRLR